MNMTSSPYIRYIYILRCVYISNLGQWDPVGAASPRGEPLAKFFKNSLLLHSLSNGHGPRPPNPVVFLKMTPKFWGKFRKWDFEFFLKFFFSNFFFGGFEFDVLKLEFWIWSLKCGILHFPEEKAWDVNLVSGPWWGQYPPGGETLAKFFKNSLFFHCASNGHGPSLQTP